MPRESFRYPYDIKTTLEAGPVTALGNVTSPEVLSRLTDRDRTLESLLDLWLQRYAIRATRITSNQTFNAGSFSTMVFNSVAFVNNGYDDTVGANTGSAYNTVTGVYTVPRSGLYAVAARTRFTAAVGGQTIDFALLQLNKNGTGIARGDEFISVAATTTARTLYTEVQCTQNDTLAIQGFANTSGGGQVLLDFIDNTSTFNWFTVHRMGPYATPPTA